MIDPTFRNDDNDPTRDCLDKYYTSLVEIKNFNALINNNLFFDQPIKNKQEAYEKRDKLSRKDDFTTGHSLDY